MTHIHRKRASSVACAIALSLGAVFVVVSCSSDDAPTDPSTSATTSSSSAGPAAASATGSGGAAGSGDASSTSSTSSTGGSGGSGSGGRGSGGRGGGTGGSGTGGSGTGGTAGPVDGGPSAKECQDYCACYQEKCATFVPIPGGQTCASFCATFTAPQLECRNVMCFNSEGPKRNNNSHCEHMVGIFECIVD